MDLMVQSIEEVATLRNGVDMPWFGLGVFLIQDGEPVEKAVQWALEAGYRSIDTAAVYRNERGVGNAIDRSAVPREEIFVTTKVWNTDQGFDSTLKAFDASLNRLRMEYVDLYLVHWPVKGKYKETWQAMEKIYHSGRAKAIGVSNFLEHHLTDVMETAEVPPMVDQVEFHPRLQQPELQEFCRQYDIQLEAWRPIMRGQVNDIPELEDLAQKYGKTPVQVTLRWMIQKGIVTIPKSENKERIRSNADIFEFEIEPGDLATIDGLDRDERLGEHPDVFHF